MGAAFGRAPSELRAEPPSLGARTNAAMCLATKSAIRWASTRGDPLLVVAATDRIWRGAPPGAKVSRARLNFPWRHAVPHPPPAKPDPNALPELLATRVLQRASELDATRMAATVDVTVLRAAASEAGISAGAFDAALAELQEAEQARWSDPRARSRRGWRPWILAAAGVVLIAAAAATVVQRLVPTVPAAVAGPPMVDEAYFLRCLSAMDAIDLTRRHLTLRENTVKLHEGSRVLNVRATPAQQQQVKAVLAQYESAASPACASGPTGAASR
jgi:hypothetical protein